MLRGYAAMVTVERLDKGAGEACAAVLPTLPTWFGVPDANADYVATADASPTFVAFDGNRPVGLTTITRHGDYAAEVHLMAVIPELHRGGVGRRMLTAAEEWLRAEGVEYLQVKTLSATHPDEGYAKTRAFYRAMGFRELEEFPELWDPSNPALQMIKRL
jgi:GNAT superfamily N-acetyltransferase